MFTIFVYIFILFFFSIYFSSFQKEAAFIMAYVCIYSGRLYFRFFNFNSLSFVYMYNYIYVCVCGKQICILFCCNDSF